MTRSLIGIKKYIQTLISGLTFLWYIEAINIMIKNNHINTYKSKLRDNRVYCSMAGGIYSTNHDMKVPFIKSEFSSSKIIAHLFRVNNMEGYSGMGDDIIIVCYQIVYRP